MQLLIGLLAPFFFIDIVQEINGVRGIGVVGVLTLSLLILTYINLKKKRRL